MTLFSAERRTRPPSWSVHCLVRKVNKRLQTPNPVNFLQIGALLDDHLSLINLILCKMVNSCRNFLT